MILGNRSPKGIFGQIMSVFPHGSLASVSRSQWSESFLILRVDSSKFKSKFNLLLLKNVIVKEMKVKKRVRTIAHKQACCFKQNRVEREGFTVQRMSLNQNTLLLLKKTLRCNSVIICYWESWQRDRRQMVSADFSGLNQRF